MTWYAIISMDSVELGRNLKRFKEYQNQEKEEVEEIED